MKPQCQLCSRSGKLVATPGIGQVCDLCRDLASLINRRRIRRWTEAMEAMRPEERERAA